MEDGYIVTVYRDSVWVSHTSLAVWRLGREAGEAHRGPLALWLLSAVTVGCSLLVIG